VIILQFQGGLLQAPLNPLKTDVSRGPPGLSGGPGPLGPHRNSTTGNTCYMRTNDSALSSQYHSGIAQKSIEIVQSFTKKMGGDFLRHNVICVINLFTA